MFPTYANSYALFSAINNGDATAEKLLNFYWYTRAAGISGDVTDIALIHDGVSEWVRYTHDENRYEVMLTAVYDNTEDPRRVDDHVLVAE